MNLRGRNILVTGGAVGIGRQITLELLHAGANVAFQFPPTDFREAEILRQKLESLATKEPSPTYHLIEADFSNCEAAVIKCRAGISVFTGKIDALINNAGVSWIKPIETVTMYQFDRLFDINFKTPYFLTQEVARSMKNQGGGVIINIASIHAFRGSPGASVYAATKGAIVALTQQLAIELGPDNIRVNAIAPGYIDVPRHKMVNPNYDPIADGQKIPIGRVGTPQDIAKLACFLASDDASFINGQTIIADGASTCWMGVHENARQRIADILDQPYMY